MNFLLSFAYRWFTWIRSSRQDRPLSEQKGNVKTRQTDSLKRCVPSSKVYILGSAFKLKDSWRKAY